MSVVRLIFTRASPPNKFLTAAVSMVVFGHKALDAILYFFNSPAQPIAIMLMLYLLMV